MINKTTLRVEAGIPIPDRRDMYPWVDMRVGDSFFIDKPTNTVLNACAGRTKSHRKERYTTRYWVHNNIAGTRCWRIK